MPKFVESDLSTPGQTRSIADSHPARTGGLVLCGLIFVLCVLVSATPLQRFAGTKELKGIFTNPLLLLFGTWLPTDLHLNANHVASQTSTNAIFFLFLVALEFICYGLAIRWLYSRRERANLRSNRQTIWGIMLLIACIFILLPAMLSHDIYAYAAYGRTLIVHGANPYFVVFAQFPYDPIRHLDNWPNVPFAYGPVWLLACTISTILAGSDPLAYVLFYRILGLVAHILNMFLVSRILRSMGRTPQTCTMGLLLYGWNPLVIQESCLGGHADSWMMTFVLLGIFFCTKFEQKKHRKRLTTATLQQFLPALLAFMLATLTKYSAIPLVLLCIIWITYRALQPDHNRSFRLQWRMLNWQAARRTVIISGLICIGCVLISYGPFWIGHPIMQIVTSFTSPPAANQTYGSILDALVKSRKAYNPAHGALIATLLRFTTSHRLWSFIEAGTVAITLLLGALWLWREPTVRTLLLATLLILSAVLVVTPWFFPWYLVWLVGLAAIALPTEKQDRIAWALIAFALTFSATSHFIYLFAKGYAPIGAWSGFTFLTTLAAPFVALLLCLLWPTRKIQ